MLFILYDIDICQTCIHVYICYTCTAYTNYTLLCIYIHTQYWAPPFITPRDFVALGYRCKLADGAIVATARSLEHEAMPPVCMYRCICVYLHICIPAYAYSCIYVQVCYMPSYLYDYASCICMTTGERKNKG